MSIISKVSKAALAATFLGSILASAYGCDQQKPKCATGRGAFIAKYTYVSGDSPCEELKGEKLGLQTYNGSNPDKTPDLDRASIAIQAESLGLLVDNAAAAGLADPDSENKAYAFGAFTTNEPVGDFCVVKTLTDAKQVLPEVPENADEGIAAQPATEVVYRWGNVKVYVTASAYGTQFTADLIISRDGQSCEYKVEAMYPYVDCSAPDPDDDTNTIADNNLCKAEGDPDPEAGRPVGSGINPDFPVSCDPDLKACFLTKPVPAHR